MDDLRTFAEKGDALAKRLAANFEPPLDLMFLTSSGRITSRLNSFHDFPLVHPDVSTPPLKRRGQKKLQSSADIFLEHVGNHYGCVPRQ